MNQGKLIPHSLNRLWKRSSCEEVGQFPGGPFLFYFPAW